MFYFKLQLEVHIHIRTSNYSSTLSIEITTEILFQISTTQLTNFSISIYAYRKWQDYVYIQCEYKSTKQKIKHLLREENKVKENKIS